MNQEVADTEKKMRRTESDVMKWNLENVHGLLEHKGQYYQQYFDLTKRAAVIERKLLVTRAQYRMDSKKLGDEKPLVPSRVLERRPYQNRIVDVNLKVAQLRADGIGDEHPDMQALRKQSKALKRLADKASQGGHKEFELRRNPTYTKIQDSLHSSRVQLKSLTLEAEKVDRDLKKLSAVIDRVPQLERERQELRRAYEEIRPVYSKIFAQREATNLQLSLEYAATAARYDVVMEPIVEYTPPTKIMGFCSSSHRRAFSRCFFESKFQGTHSSSTVAKPMA